MEYFNSTYNTMRKMFYIALAGLAISPSSSALAGENPCNCNDIMSKLESKLPGLKKQGALLDKLQGQLDNPSESSSPNNSIDDVEPEKKLEVETSRLKQMSKSMDLQMKYMDAFTQYTNLVIEFAPIDKQAQDCGCGPYSK